MGIAPSKNTAQSEAVLNSIRKEILDALKVIFIRANDPHTTESRDKENLTNCEFGMILLLTNDWFRSESLEDDFYAAIDKAEYELVVPNLVGRVVNRVLPQKQDHEGGEGHQICFFTGEPYTKYQKGRATKFSAHLDAAMITLTFLALAVEQFNEPLTKVEYQKEQAAVPEWVNSLRDAALFVILEGLKYATECRVIHNGKFLGFTSDPVSNRNSPENGGLEKEYDRLFFSWTACETINDMRAWRESYLGSDIPQPPPLKANEDLKSLIKELEESLTHAAEWCADHFLPEFEKFTIEDTRDVIRQVNQAQLKGVKFDEHVAKRVANTAAYVQHVYHFSQYAAIRSLVPEKLTLEEVRTIADRLDRLVQTSIMSSGLDDSKQEDLFGTLTRTYSLGESNSNDYADDAWYPLVVRSVAGLLSRTLSDFRGKYSRSEVQALTLMFQRSLDVHLSNLLVRRPNVVEEGDEKLWSFANDQPYVLYATQRTIFALMQYAGFVNAIDRFQAEEPDVDRREEELSLLVARRLATDYFRPVIRELLAQITPQPPAAVTAAAPVNFPLPEEVWAAEVLRHWLMKLKDDFRDSQIANTVESTAARLRLVKLNAERYQPSEVLNQPNNSRKKKGALEQLDGLKRDYEKIRGSGALGKKLSELEDWNKDQLKPLLFEHLVGKYLRGFETIERLLKEEPSEEWKLINDAISTCESISQLDPEGSLI
jgi:hypothetical protein